MPSSQAGTGERAITPLKKFTCFPKLPKELQLEVWKDAAFHGRNIGLWVKDVWSKEHGLFYRYNYFYSTCRQPSILHVCKESRAEALQFYKLEFGINGEFVARGQQLWDGIRNPGRRVVSVKIPPRIYINYAVDRLCIMDPGYHPRAAFEGILKICKASQLKFVAYGISSYLDSAETDLYSNAFWEGLQKRQMSKKLWLSSLNLGRRSKILKVRVLTFEISRSTLTWLINWRSWATQLERRSKSMRRQSLVLASKDTLHPR